LNKPPTPLRDRLLARPVSLGNLLAGITLRAIQHDLGTKVQPSASRPPSTPALELRSFLVAQLDLRGASSHGQALNDGVTNGYDFQLKSNNGTEH
jgi:hypothetical protein